MRAFNYSKIRDNKWDSELLGLIAAIYKEMGKQELEKWKEIAQVGDSEALFHLGECYAHGKGVKNDKEIARFYFEKNLPYFQ